MATHDSTSALAFLQSSSLPMLMQEEIERLIMNGELAVGSRINESELSQRFSTSRGPIREALRALEEAGLVRNEKNRGVFVREIAFEEADEIYELREALEEIIGRRVAERMQGDALERLRAMIEPMREAAQAQNVEQYAQLNLQFHDILLDTAGSRKLTETYKRLVKELHLFRMRALDSGGGLRVSADEHREIVDAIATRNPEAAGQVLRKHVAGSRARMHKAMGRADAGPVATPVANPAAADNNPTRKET
jgi:phosphonate utilization transcriptional regulator